MEEKLYAKLTEEDRRNIVMIINNANVKGESSEYVSNLKKKILIPLKDDKPNNDKPKDDNKQ